MRGHSTDRASLTIARARQEALRVNAGRIGPEHLLLALIDHRERMHVPAKALAASGVSLQATRAKLEEIGGSGHLASWGARLPRTSGLRKILTLAAREAVELGDRSVDDVHLLLAMVRNKSNYASQLLADQGANYDRVREQILTLRGPATGRSE